MVKSLGGSRSQVKRPVGARLRVPCTPMTTTVHPVSAALIKTTRRAAR